MLGVSRYTQARSPESICMTGLPSRQDGTGKSALDLRILTAAHDVGRRPVAHEGCVSRPPNVQRVPLQIGGYPGGGDGPHPACSPFPRADGVRIVDADSSVLFNDPPATLRNLPLHRITREPLGRP